MYADRKYPVTVFIPLKDWRLWAEGKLRLWVDLCGLPPARKRSNGGLGALEDSPQLNSNGLHVRWAIVRAACECEAARRAEAR